jgi:hypothetical protein
MLHFEIEQILHQFAALSYGHVCVSVFLMHLYGQKDTQKFHTLSLQSPSLHSYCAKIYTCVIQSMKLANNTVASL